MKTKLLIGFLTMATFSNAQYTRILDFADTNGSTPISKTIFEGASSGKIIS